MRILAILCLLALFSCESSVKNEEPLHLTSSEVRIGGGGGAVDIDKDKISHSAKAHYKKTIVPGTAANNWQSTYYSSYSTGSGSSHSAARASAESNLPYGAIFIYSTCVSGPGH
jgi:hypothetical protein